MENSFCTSKNFSLCGQLCMERSRAAKVAWEAFKDTGYLQDYYLLALKKERLRGHDGLFGHATDSKPSWNG